MHASTLVDALKRLLKAHGVTYAQVAAALELSEASVKRMFSRRDFTLQRLEDVCRVVGIDFGDLARALADEHAGVTQLTMEQEKAIVSDPKVFLVALCAVGNWTIDQIVDTYNLSRLECVKCLTKLDRLRIIELQPGDRIKPLIGRTFSWLPDGPFQRYFRSQVGAEYLSSTFDRPDELFLFVSGMLSNRSLAELKTQMRKLAADFAELHRDDVSLPLAQRHGSSAMLAIRPWEPRAFRALRRGDRAPVAGGQSLHPGSVAEARPGKRLRR
jgi:AcrR family transcriptional regulator